MFRFLTINFRLLFWLVLLTFYFSAQAFAATTQSLSINNLPLTIDQSQEFEVGVTFLCPSCTSDSYLRSVFYPSGSSYFGYTQDNSGNWNNAAGGNCTTYFKVVQADFTKEGTWSGRLKVKPDIASPYYNGPGEYMFKVGRYTSSCGSPLWSTETTIAITGPSPTPTLTPTSVTTSTTAPSKSLTPTSIPTPTVKKISTPTVNPTIEEEASLSAMVLGESSESAESSPTGSSANKKDVKVLGSQEDNLPKIFIGLSLILFLACGILAYKIKKEN